MSDRDFCLICAMFCGFCVLALWLVARGLKSSIERHIAILEREFTEPNNAAKTKGIYEHGLVWGPITDAQRDEDA